MEERLFREADLTLKKAIDICRAAKVSQEQVKSLTDRNSADIDALHKTNKVRVAAIYERIFEINKTESTTIHGYTIATIVVNNMQPNHAQRTGNRATIAINSDILPNSADRPTDNVKGNPFAIYNAKKISMNTNTALTRSKQHQHPSRRKALHQRTLIRAVARTLIGGVYIHIFWFCPTDFF